MIRRAAGAFRAAGSPPVFNILGNEHQANGVGVGGWSTGTTQLDQVRLDLATGRGPGTAGTPVVLGFSVIAQLGLYLQLSPNSLPVYGKLSKVLAGITDQGAPTTQLSPIGGTYESGTLLPLPRDASLVASLWDPAADPLPPISGVIFSAGGPPPLTVTANVSLPQPVPLSRGDLMVGMWVLPSLVSPAGAGFADSRPSVSAAIASAQYVVTYDDGN